MFSNKLQVCLWAYFQRIRESWIKWAYKRTPQGKAEAYRVYWSERDAYLKRLSNGG